MPPAWRLVRGDAVSQAEPALQRRWCETALVREFRVGRPRPNVVLSDPFVSRVEETDDRHAVGGGTAAEPCSRAAVQLVGRGSLMMRSSQSEPKNVLFGMRTGPSSLRRWVYLTATPPHRPLSPAILPCTYLGSNNPSHHPCKQGSTLSCGPCLGVYTTR